VVRQKQKKQHSIYKAELERAKARQQTIKAKVMKRKRTSTVESALGGGTLINFTGMKRLNARGLKAGKQNAAAGSHNIQSEEVVEIYRTKSKYQNNDNAANKSRGMFCAIKNILQQLILSPAQTGKFLFHPCTL
jgi:predicted Zn-dependent protease